MCGSVSNCKDASDDRAVVRSPDDKATGVCTSHLSQRLQSNEGGTSGEKNERGGDGNRPRTESAGVLAAEIAVHEPCDADGDENDCKSHERGNADTNDRCVACTARGQQSSATAKQQTAATLANVQGKSGVQVRSPDQLVTHRVRHQGSGADNSSNPSFFGPAMVLDDRACHGDSNASETHAPSRVEERSENAALRKQVESLLARVESLERRHVAGVPEGVRQASSPPLLLTPPPQVSRSSRGNYGREGFMMGASSTPFTGLDLLFRTPGVSTCILMASADCIAFAAAGEAPVLARVPCDAA